MGFTTPTETSEGPGGETVTTPGQSFGDKLGKGLESYANQRAPIMSQLLGFAPKDVGTGTPEGGFPDFIPGTIPKSGPVLQMLMKAFGAGG
jgi:hypothetical protein